MVRKKRKVFGSLILFSVLLILLGLYVLYSLFSADVADVTATRASYVCNDNKNIISWFYPDRVSLELSDGRVLSIDSAPSASGSKYQDGSQGFVFWATGNGAFFEERNVVTYSSCVSI